MQSLKDTESERFFQFCADQKILVLGDLIVDRYIHARVTRISPEAPVPVLLKSHSTAVLGGAGNVAANICSLGGQTLLCGVLGSDSSGKEFLDLCEAAGINTTGIIATDETCTITKTRFVSAGNQIIRFDEELNSELSETSKNRLFARLQRLIQSADLVVISDYDKGVLRNGVAEEVIAMARAQSKSVFVDPKGSDYSRYANATTITPNLKELSEAVKRPIESDEDVERAGRELMDALGLDFIVSTRSEKGMSVISANAAHHLPTRAREVFDVSGAGDTVVATLALASAVGLDPIDSAQIANAAAAVAVSKTGTACVYATEVETELVRRSGVSQSANIATDFEVAQAMAEQWKEKGFRVGFTNGCFDILHFGHVSLLERARAQCDKLIVGLNADLSVTALKGETRPINRQEDRARILAALRHVDGIVIFSEETPLELIRALEPNILFKGGDYKIEDVVGREIVTSLGGEVILLDLEEGRSTTNLVNQMRES